MSAGIRSGVNWMRWNLSSKTCAIERTSSVLARPGAPVIRQCPPANRLIRSCCETSFWPTMTFDSSRSIRPRLSWIFSTTCFSSSYMSVSSAIRGSLLVDHLENGRNGYPDERGPARSGD